MCQNQVNEQAGRQVWSCMCSCPATMTIGEEIRLLEDHREYFQERIAEIDRKIQALRPAREP